MISKPTAFAIEDLVRAKKTQRDKDWPMIRRLVEAHYEENQDAPSDAMINFWLREPL
jgi:protein-disulfide isomerase-like protein with CxxC motif